MKYEKKACHYEEVKVEEPCLWGWVGARHESE